MKNKGFTLIELLTVIVLLGVIMAITVPIIVNTISDSRYDSCEENVRTIENAAERWHAANPGTVSEDDDNYTKTVEELQNEGYLSASDEIINPITGESMNDVEVKITYDAGYNQYNYEVVDDVCEK